MHHNLMITMNPDGKSWNSPEKNQCHIRKLKPAKRGLSQGWQKQRSALFPSQPRENVNIRRNLPTEELKISPFFVSRVIAVAMAVRFIIITLIWFAIFMTLLCNNEVPVSSASSRENYFAQCHQDWIYYRNNCYQFFNESKNWNQSQASCLSQNSSLLKIYSREDQDFLKLLKSFHWMGLVQANDSWKWEDGSTFSRDQLTLVEMVESGSCAVYGSNFKAYTENCSVPYTYICMKKAVSGLD